MERSDIVFTYMKEEDVKEAALIERAVCSMPWSEQGFLDALKQDTLFVTARTGEILAGYCGMYCSFDEGEITNVAVRPEMQGQGIGTGILNFFLVQARNRGIGRIVLEVRVSNGPAIRLYEKSGFEKAGLRRNFYDKPREDACIMVLEDNTGKDACSMILEDKR